MSRRRRSVRWNRRLPGAEEKRKSSPASGWGCLGLEAAHLCLQVLRHWGWAHVFTRSAAHQRHALALGAVRAAEAPTGQERLDKAVVFAPAGEVVVRALEALRPGGIVSINAIHMSDIPSSSLRPPVG